MVSEDDDGEIVGLSQLVRKVQTDPDSERLGSSWKRRSNVAIGIG
jgi:hypothetical protein